MEVLSIRAVLLLLLALMPLPPSSSPFPDSTVMRDREAALRMARNALARAKSLARASMILAAVEGRHGTHAWADCAQLYEDSEQRLQRLYEPSDGLTWLSAALSCHTTCVDGLHEWNASAAWLELEEVTASLRKALAVHASSPELRQDSERNNRISHWNSTSLSTGLLASWDASTDKADIVVAQDGSGNYKTINEAVAALSRWQQGGSRRVIIYIKSGLYPEYVEIDRNARNVMLVGDGIDKTIVTGSRSVADSFTTYKSATFGVSGDGFWVRDMTFENTAGPEKHQAVALRAASDLSVFYRCSFRGYQDTLYVHSGRQFYRDCHIYGTIDFIFGNAAAVLQNCDIIVRKPLEHQSNMITAQGREDPNQNTGISVHGSRVVPAQDFEAVKSLFSSYLGRPWKKYSRTVFLKTDLDGLVHPNGWATWEGRFALSTLYFGEYMNMGQGAATDKRVNWPGFHVITESTEASQFTVGSFIQGESWIPESDVPFWAGI